MLWKLTVSANVLFGLVSAETEKQPMERLIKMEDVNAVKDIIDLSFKLKRFCNEDKYQYSVVCETFSKCKCGTDQDGLLDCFAQECEGVPSFFCGWQACMTDHGDEEARTECQLSKCATYKGSLDEGETAICVDMEFTKAMKECQLKGRGNKNVLNTCVDQICSDGSFQEQCDRKQFWKNMSECYKNFSGRENKNQREECQQSVCVSDVADEKACKQIAFFKYVKECNTTEEATKCLVELCSNENCNNAYCKRLNKRNGTVKCHDPCA